MYLKRNTVIAFFGAIVCSIVIFLLKENGIEALTFMCFFSLFIIYLGDLKRNAYILLFLCTFFVFLLGRPFIEVFFGVIKDYNVISLTNDAINHTYKVLMIGLIFLAIGYSSRITSKNNTYYIGKHNSVNLRTLNSVKICSKCFLYIFYICAIVVNVEKALFVSMFGYLESYMSYASKLPSIITQFADMAPVSIAVFLATLPTKKEVRIPLIMFLIANLLNLLGGTRYEAVSAVLFIFLYSIFRNKIDAEIWIDKKMIIACVLLVPVIMVFLISVEFWRGGRSIAGMGWKNLLETFFSSVGGSASIIGYEYMYHEQLVSNDILYSFGGIWKSLHSNIIATKIFDCVVYQPQTVQNALYGHDLASFIAYKVNATRYLNGGGLGSCYLAELYCDFSYIGVAIGSIAIGRCIKIFNGLRQGALVRNFFTIFISLSIFRIPRDSFDYFLNQCVGIKNILLIFTIWILALFVKKRFQSQYYSGEKNEQF